MLKYSENRIDLGLIETIVVYDMQSEHTNQLNSESSIACILLRRLASKYYSVSFLTGGLANFHQIYPNLCEHSISSPNAVVRIVETTVPIQEEDVVSLESNSNSGKPSWLNVKCKQPRMFSHSLSTFGLNLSQIASDSGENVSTMSSLSSSAASSLASSFNSGLPSAVSGSNDDENKAGGKTNKGPTEILGFLYLGSQEDSLSEQTLKDLNITNILNVSATCPKPSFIDDANFLRISINDGHGEKILPYFDVAFRFIEKCRKSNSKVLIHCLAGISRSPTLAIAYLMKHLGLKSDEAYKFVKERRKTISPNFNFLGQLYEYEKQHLASLSNSEAKNSQDVDMKIAKSEQSFCPLVESPSSSQPPSVSGNFLDSDVCWEIINLYVLD